ncbi:hypothetical protein ACQU0X_26740 [Pseudovibrio ascidiaceicola]|uniref:hypothetical protein n=1 Tax=Pseudovibrio ascidiaceicola TaxID=285279 RepID=UPI003D366E68
MTTIFGITIFAAFVYGGHSYLGPDVADRVALRRELHMDLDLMVTSLSLFKQESHGQNALALSQDLAPYLAHYLPNEQIPQRELKGTLLTWQGGNSKLCLKATDATAVSPPVMMVLLNLEKEINRDGHWTATSGPECNVSEPLQDPSTTLALTIDLG